MKIYEVQAGSSFWNGQSGGGVSNCTSCKLDASPESFSTIYGLSIKKIRPLYENPFKNLFCMKNIIVNTDKELQRILIDAMPGILLAWCNILNYVTIVLTVEG
jgi:hypothetical protein